MTNENSGCQKKAEGDAASKHEADTANLIAELEANGDFRVLRRLVPLPLLSVKPQDKLRCAIVCDTETTGLILPGGDASPSECISVALVAIAFDPTDGDIKACTGRFHRFREPSHPIPAAATAIHGIDDARVRGHRISSDDIAGFIAASAACVQDNVRFGSRDVNKLPLLIAHNAGFDRKMMEALFPDVVADLPWACSQTQIPWAEHGYEGTKLSYLSAHARFFYDDRHSALADADAVLELLRQRLGGMLAMAHLHRASQTATHRLYVATRYDPKIITALKERKYRWSAGDNGQPRAWYWEGDDAGLSDEMAYLSEAGHRETQVRQVDSFNRFSCRA